MEQIHFMVVEKNRKLCLGKNVISDPLLYRHLGPLLLRQLKNNQNQTNTTGAQHLKEFNNTAGWLSVFFWGFYFGNELIK